MSDYGTFNDELIKIKEEMKVSKENEGLTAKEAPHTQDETVAISKPILQNMVNLIASLPWVQANPVLTKLEAYLRETQQS